MDNISRAGNEGCLAGGELAAYDPDLDRFPARGSPIFSISLKIGRVVFFFELQREFNSIGNRQFAKNRLYVVLDRLQGDLQFLANFLIRVATGDQAGYLFFS